MARRYDSRTNIFSPEGRLYQVEYAMEAISHAGTAIGILAADGVVLAAEKRVVMDLLDAGTKSEKMYKIDNHVGCAVAGITADANILINYSRLYSQRYTYQYQETIPVEQLVQQLCNLKQSYTQYGGLRPFGVSYLYAGWDRHFKFQLYHSDPSGNYGGWKATAIGANNQTAQSMLKQEYNPEHDVNESLKLALRVVSKTMDSTGLKPDKLEFSTLTIDPETNKPKFHILSHREIADLIANTELPPASSSD
eukprot:TRINITY_DN1690_c0_g1_i1.p1 TRINITY_DN1690_c0_g1~~TRINITY_DN1690_c0_g1_i1.p1  ORF type:complete len:251 (+),score=124.08 TRINITY_DN1690_c0_g1_i1:80-832(+)